MIHLRSIAVSQIEAIFLFSFYFVLSKRGGLKTLQTLPLASWMDIERKCHSTAKNIFLQVFIL